MFKTTLNRSIAVLKRPDAHELLEAATWVVNTGTNKDWFETIDARALICAKHVQRVVWLADDEIITHESLHGSKELTRHTFTDCGEEIAYYTFGPLGVNFHPDGKTVAFDIDATNEDIPDCLQPRTWGELLTLCDLIHGDHLQGNKHHG